jgi:hypothetical protein
MPAIRRSKNKPDGPSETWSSGSPKYHPSGRLARAIQTNPHLAKPFLWGPVYGVKGQFGGSSMEVVLGPGAAESFRRGDSSTSSLQTLMRPLHDFDEECWVAGHLLNAELGGKDRIENLTPLTQTANKIMSSTCENKVKSWITRCSLHMRSRLRDYFIIHSNKCLGVHYKVSVPGPDFASYADRILNLEILDRATEQRRQRAYKRVSRCLEIEAELVLIEPDSYERGKGTITDPEMMFHIKNDKDESLFFSKTIENCLTHILF